MEYLVVAVIGLVLPAVCYLLETAIPRPEIIEEIFKLALVLYIAKQKNLRENKYRYTLLLGLSFAFSELFFYFINFYLSGSVGLVFYRLITTSFLHVLTYLTLISGVITKKKSLIVLALFLSVVIHFLFNFWLLK